VQASTAGDGGDQDAHGGSDQGRGVAHCLQTLVFDVLHNRWLQIAAVRKDVVLEDQATHRARVLIFRCQFSQDIDEVVVEVRIVIELLQFLWAKRMRIAKQSVGNNLPIVLQSAWLCPATASP